ncbi:hypothetical protein UFOVP1290_304 [uncultured Caudovirales phage]|uniref:Uncharacterized protein n=1 Tax=uncultured Caudovirales phage TaxID=2100421 RepID=A0A6J5RXN1_9CAUD|nr:hypothetical protein UFOVP1290_304 [uncultured Caudovirales phage]
MITIKAAKEIRSFIYRKYGYCSYPIVIRDDNMKPILIGNKSCYRTRGGTLIQHPSAYRNKGRSNMVYHPSSMRIEVGKDFIKELEIDLIQVSISRKRHRFVKRDLAKFKYYFE